MGHRGGVRYYTHAPQHTRYFKSVNHTYQDQLQARLPDGYSKGVDGVGIRVALEVNT